MKRKRFVSVILIAVILVSALIMVASAGSVGKPYKSDGRYCQNYSMTAKKQWDYTTVYGGIGVQKLYPKRNFAVEVKSNTYTTYSTAYAVFLANSDAVMYTNIAWVKGTGGNDAAYVGSFRSGETGCLGVRTDARATRSYDVSGIWSPDMYR